MSPTYWISFVFAIAMPFTECIAQIDSSKQKRGQVLIPIALVCSGTIATYTKFGSKVNTNIRNQIYQSNKHIKIDDYLALSPTVVVYGLDVLGLKAKHNFKDRTVLIGTSLIMVTPVVLGTKHITKIKRPDNSEYTSFPSGHTAIAFASAEFLRREYKDVSPWIGVGGYLVAASTGYLRIYNDRHWVSDVAAGAGLGILSTQLAYKIQPWLSSKIFRDKNTVMLLPSFRSGQLGLAFSTTF